MKNAIIHLIRFAKLQGHTISVHDGEAWPVKRSHNEREIMEAVNSVDEGTLRFHNVEGTSVGAATFINGLDNDELIADYACTPFMAAWQDQYDADNSTGLYEDIA